MRNFNDYEKYTLKLMVNIQNHNSTSLRLNTLFTEMALDSNVGLKFDGAKEVLTVITKPINTPETNDPNFIDAFQKIKKQKDEFFQKYFMLISLIEYLEKEHLIYFFPYKENKLISFTTNDIYEETEFGTFDITTGEFRLDYIITNYSKTIFVTPELETFINKGFKDKEQIRHNQSLWAAYSLGFVSILVAVIPLFDPFKHTFSSLFKIIFLVVRLMNGN